MKMATSIQDITTGIEVSVVAVVNGKAGKPYPVRDDPASGGKRSEKNTGFLEVESGQQYGVKVVLHRTFDFMKQMGIRITYDIDGDENDIYHSVLQTDRKQRNGTREDLLLSFADEVDGEVKCFGLAFAKSEIVEDADNISEEEEARDACGRGKITITLQRGKIVKRTVGEAGTGGKHFIPSVPTTAAQTTKKIAVDKGKGFFTECVDLGDAPGSGEWLDFEPPRGLKKGQRPKVGSVHEQIKFTFYYLARDYLERKGILPFIRESGTREDATVVSDGNNSDSTNDELASSSRNTTVTAQTYSRHASGGDAIRHFPPVVSTSRQRRHSRRGRPNGRRAMTQASTTSRDDEEFIVNDHVGHIKADPSGEDDTRLESSNTASRTPQYSQRLLTNSPEQQVSPGYEDQRDSMYDVTPGYEHSNMVMLPGNDDLAEEHLTEVQSRPLADFETLDDQQSRRSATRSTKRAASQESEHPRRSYSSIDNNRARKEARLERRILRQQQRVAELELRQLQLQRELGMLSSAEE